MSDKRIIYPNANGGVSIIIPMQEWLSIEGNTMEVLAAKEVPAGRPWKIVDANTIPTDRTFRDAWEYVA